MDGEVFVSTLDIRFVIINHIFERGIEFLNQCLGMRTHESMHNLWKMACCKGGTTKGLMYSEYFRIIICLYCISNQPPLLRAMCYRSRRIFPTHFCISLHPSITRQTGVRRRRFFIYPSRVELLELFLPQLHESCIWLLQVVRG